MGVSTVTAARILEGQQRQVDGESNRLSFETLPWLAAIEAALHPETSKALYFVSKGGGRHVFSETLDAHNRAVNRYQRGR
jgi:hypothetical protein